MTERRNGGDRRNHLMTDREVAEKARVSAHTVRYWRQTGVLPFVRVGRTPRVWYSEFLKVFQKPLPHWTLEAGKMAPAGSIRRQT